MTPAEGPEPGGAAVADAPGSVDLTAAGELIAGRADAVVPGGDTVLVVEARPVEPVIPAPGMVPAPDIAPVPGVVPARDVAPAPEDLGAALELLTGPPTDRADGLAVTRTGRPVGSAPALLLVHGLGAARSVWAPVLPELARRYHVVVVDLPGHGDSPAVGPGEERMRQVAVRLARACAALGVPRPHVVGNSLGGWAGLELAADGGAASLTALAPAGLRKVPTRPHPILRLNRRLAVLTGPLADPLVAIRLIRGLVFASGTTDPRGLDLGLARAIARAMRQAQGYDVMLAATAHARFERAADVTVPVTVVLGDSDRILPGAANRCRELAPAQSRWLTLPRCGHAPMWDAPARTVQLIDETVARAAP